MGVIDENLYPDIASMGGLISAMETVARREGLNLGGVYSQYTSGPGLFITAEVDSNRGRISVSLGGGDRTFFLGIHQPGFTWADGATGDFRVLVEAVAAWRAGMAVDEFVGKFSFVTLGRLARSLEGGDPIAAQWDFLRKSEVFVAERELIDSVYADDRFRRLFPALSHGTLRLSTDRLGAQGAREIHISPLVGGSYRVEDTASSIAKVAASLKKALAAAAESLTGN
ncbi:MULTISPECIES: DUF6193 family natural product biosynthesis protein [Streptomyces]|uniref:DUF6193 family natural product biosynthesis protein n=1 Tax=Streptomyces anulatus TaxID=1892 RepID=A0ABZ1ZWT2_STRAQ|nr:MULTISPECIES: DUF6193 family natural product biosynthesis protein [Streptomyces]MBT1105684.1 hypothetical protein [Streptomyces sp. Tu10]WSU94239.1 DUF6193 family natural product biosynthesis protein [Streptomyces anulatus]